VERKGSCAKTEMLLTARRKIRRRVYMARRE